LSRHLEGWQPGLLAIFVAGVPALLAVPRPVAPLELPEPFLEPRALAEVARQDEALASQAEHDRLDADVRALGSALRSYSLADASDDAAAVAVERRNVADAAKLAAKQGDAALAKLRAYHLRSFLRELRRWEATGEESTELRELGGPFLSRARKNGWTHGRRLLLDEAVRAALFKKRWIELAMVRGPLLDLVNVERRALERFLLLHPPEDPGASTNDPRDKTGAQRAPEIAEQYRLKKIDELRALDPAYPADLARGVVFFRLHRFPQAVEALRKHLEDHPDGPYAVRAENYLRAALGGAMDAL
jgi:hypothetical protein